MSEWMDEQINKWRDGWMGQMNELVSRKMGGQLEGWMGEWMDA